MGTGRERSNIKPGDPVTATTVFTCQFNSSANDTKTQLDSRIIFRDNYK